MFQDLRYETEHAMAAGDQAFVAYRMTATQDGKPIDIAGVMHFTLRDGHIARRVDYWDGVTYLRQVGAGLD
jgi:ketosteroid isomerase-like protein